MDDGELPWRQVQSCKFSLVIAWCALGYKRILAARLNGSADACFLTTSTVSHLLERCNYPGTSCPANGLNIRRPPCYNLDLFTTRSAIHTGKLFLGHFPLVLLQLRLNFPLIPTSSSPSVSRALSSSPLVTLMELATKPTASLGARACCHTHATPRKSKPLLFLGLLDVSRRFMDYDLRVTLRCGSFVGITHGPPGARPG